jgi:hypothetical protein
MSKHSARRKTRKLAQVTPVLAAPPTQRHVHSWRAVGGGELLCELFCANDDATTCNIMHEATRAVEIEDLPRVWPSDLADAVSGATCDSAQLACGHVFHPAALALHFLVSDMRCPVCRDGLVQPMDIECLPSAMRPAFARKIESVKNAAFDPQAREELRADILHVLSNLEVVFSVLGAHGEVQPRMTTRTRVIYHQHHVEAIEQQVVQNTGLCSEFEFHRSFQRLLRSVVARQLEHNAAGRVRFSLTHPLVPVTIASQEFTIAAVWDSFFNVLPEHRTHVCPDPPEPVHLYCAAVAGADPVGSIKAQYHDAAAPPKLTAELNTLMLVNIAAYVRTVLESIREAVQHHTSFDSYSVEVSTESINGVVFAS